MPRKPRVLRTKNGDCELRVVIPKPIVLVCERVASDLGIGFEPAIRLFLRQTSALLEVGQAGFLGPIFETALKQARAENFDVISSGPPLDISVLHRSNKLKSGFAGVYASGAGFRAVGPGGKYIVTAPTAEEAAHRRRLYYIDNKLPYGELELDVERWRRDNPHTAHQTDLEVARSVVEYSIDKPYWPILEGDARRLLGDAVVDRIQSGLPALPPEAFVPPARPLPEKTGLILDENAEDPVEDASLAYEQAEREKEERDAQEEREEQERLDAKWAAEKAKFCAECGVHGPHLCA